MRRGTSSLPRFEPISAGEPVRNYQGIEVKESREKLVVESIWFFIRGLEGTVVVPSNGYLASPLSDLRDVELETS